jgi:ATP-binding cassette subfamily D (ALD) protein 3
MTIGTLRDQIIYPDSHGDMRRKGIKDENLNELLEKVQLIYLIQREGGFEGVQDWMDVLSGGEKQRIAVSSISIFVEIHFVFLLH